MFDASRAGTRGENVKVTLLEGDRCLLFVRHPPILMQIHFEPSTANIDTSHALANLFDAVLMRKGFVLNLAHRAITRFSTMQLRKQCARVVVDVMLD